MEERLSELSERITKAEKTTLENLENREKKMETERRIKEVAQKIAPCIRAVPEGNLAVFKMKTVDREDREDQEEKRKIWLLLGKKFIGYYEWDPFEEKRREVFNWWPREYFFKENKENEENIENIEKKVQRVFEENSFVYKLFSKAVENSNVYLVDFAEIKTI